MGFKHTPGPWKGLHGDGINKKGNKHVVSGNKNICIITKSENDTYNTRLITAAPKMLGALVEIAKHAKESDVICEQAVTTFDIAKYAIEKATGMKIEEVLKIK